MRALRSFYFIEFSGIVVMKTFSAKAEKVQHDWLLVDAADQVLGRLAAQIAARLRGKHKAIYTPHVDTGDFVVVVNADKLRVTGNKTEAKLYHRHTTYPGGLYTTNFAKMQERHPGRALEKAVKGMLPKGPLGYAMLRKMKVYAGTTHPHEAQQPKPVNLLKALS
jgi:large subunit ribosomal protein L13